MLFDRAHRQKHDPCLARRLGDLGPCHGAHHVVHSGLRGSHARAGRGLRLASAKHSYRFDAPCIEPRLCPGPAKLRNRTACTAAGTLGGRQVNRRHRWAATAKGAKRSALRRRSWGVVDRPILIPAADNKPGEKGLQPLSAILAECLFQLPRELALEDHQGGAALAEGDLSRISRISPIACVLIDE